MKMDLDGEEASASLASPPAQTKCEGSFRKFVVEPSQAGQDPGLDPSLPSHSGQKLTEAAPVFPQSISEAASL